MARPSLASLFLANALGSHVTTAAATRAQAGPISFIGRRSPVWIGEASLERVLARVQASEPEDIERRARLHALELGRGIDEPLVPCAAHSDEDRDILLAVDGECHRGRAHAAAGVEAPEFLERLAVERVDLARGFAGEDQIGRRERAAEVGELRFVFPGDLAGRDVDRGDAAGDAERLRRTAAGEELARLFR